MNYKLIVLFSSILSVNIASAMEPWMAASSSQSLMARKAAPKAVLATPAQQIEAKQNELTQINNQLKTASSSERVQLLNKKTQLEKEIKLLSLSK